MIQSLGGRPASLIEEDVAHEGFVEIGFEFPEETLGSGHGHYPAAYHDILDSKRCSCNAWNSLGIIGTPDGP